MAGSVVLRFVGTLRRFSSRAEPNLPPASYVLYPPWRTSPVRFLQLCPVLCAGHNKWSKVKHIKGPKDAARANVFTKLSLMLRLAVKEGGSNPETNLNLAHIIEQCRARNMPKSSIEAAIQSGAKPESQHIFEARGPGGCSLLIEVLTDNKTRTHQEVRRLLTKNGGTVSDKTLHNFNKRGVVVVSGQNILMERALELAIEVGAEDVQESQDEEEQPLLQFICDMTDVRKVQTSLEDQGLQIISAGFEFVPTMLQSLDQDQLEVASTLIEILSENAEVVRVWDNIHFDS